MRPLVIIDMQSNFRDCYTADTVAGCKHEIKAARMRGDWVFFVQYNSHGDTDRRLTRLVDGYPRKKRIWKWKDDGADKVLLRMIKLGMVQLKSSFDLNAWIIAYHSWDSDRVIDRHRKRFRNAVISAPTELRICGVNLQYCVAATYQGLCKQLGKTDITLVAGAVHSENDDDDLEDLLTNWKTCGNRCIEGRESALQAINARLKAAEQEIITYERVA